MNQARAVRNSFKIQFPGNENVKAGVQDKFQNVKTKLHRLQNSFVSNTDVINAVLDFWLAKNENRYTEPYPGSYQQVDKDGSMQDIFLTASDSLQSIVDMTDHHARYCSHQCKVTKQVRRGHVMVATLKCNSGTTHTFTLASSPYLPNQEYLVNHRLYHAFVCSGMLPVHYTRFSKAAKMGCMTRQKRKKLTNKYKDSVQHAHDELIDDALAEEMFSNEDINNINIMTDARHGWRKKAKDTSVVAIGEETHKVLRCEHVTKANDIVSQRHEMKGTKQIYEYFESKDVSVKVHTHDRNMAVNRMVKDSPYTRNQNDCWHGVKGVKKSLQAVSSGPKYKEGTAWSVQLVDKVEPVCTHVHWAIKNCDEDPEKLKSSLLNVVKHYRNEHEQCDNTSRCKKDPNYEPSRTVITNPKAEKMLESVIEKSVIYKSPKDYVLGRETSYVESFNNVMNVFQDKGIAFSDLQYNMRAQLAVLHWNENVDREYTSVYNPRDQRAPRRMSGKKNYKKLGYRYRTSIWDTYMNSMFPGRNAR